VSIDPIAPQAATRLIYPKLAQRLTPADLHRLSSPSYEERRWVPAVRHEPSTCSSVEICLSNPHFGGHPLVRCVIERAACVYA
jgi:hypothetical protein